jgi:hypothetical protein
MALAAMSSPKISPDAENGLLLVTISEVRSWRLETSDDVKVRRFGIERGDG